MKMTASNALGNASTTVVATSPMAFTSMELAHWLWIALGAAAGAVTALSLPAYQALTRQGKIFTAAIGFTFALFLGPVIAPVIYKLFSSADNASTGGMGACYYLIGLIGNSVVPVTVKRISSVWETTMGGMVKQAAVDASVVRNQAAAAATNPPAPPAPAQESE